MTQGFTVSGDGFIRIQAALRNLNSRVGQSATLDVGWDSRTKYPDGTYVATVARIQEFGGVIEHPGGTRYIKDAVVGKRGKLFLGTRFVGPDFKGDTLTTGAHLIRIPARPFIRPAVAAGGSRWSDMVWNDVMDTDMPVDAILEKLGIVITADIQKAIQSVTTPPLARSTIRKRLSKGFSDHSTATKPLVDTGTMLRTIRSQVTVI